MRENRPYGSEGGVGESPSRPLSKMGWNWLPIVWCGTLGLSVGLVCSVANLG